MKISMMMITKMYVILSLPLSLYEWLFLYWVKLILNYHYDVTNSLCSCTPQLCHIQSRAHFNSVLTRTQLQWE